MAFVEFKDVRKIYTMGEVQVAAVDGMSFEIEQGELVVVVGPSGSGKTTLLNMMGGMDSCTSGSITLDGARVDQFDEKQLTDYRRYDIGFVFQFYNLVQKSYRARKCGAREPNLPRPPSACRRVGSGGARASHG